MWAAGGELHENQRSHLISDDFVPTYFKTHGEGLLEEKVLKGIQDSLSPRMLAMSDRILRPS